MRPRALTCKPSEGRKRIARFTPRKQPALSWADSSLIVKYQWPDAAALKFDISPSTQTDAKRFSSAPRTCEVSSETDSGRRSISSNSDASRGLFMRAIEARGARDEKPDADDRNSGPARADGGAEAYGRAVAVDANADAPFGGRGREV